MSLPFDKVQKHYNEYQNTCAATLSHGINEAILARWRPNGRVKVNLGYGDCERPALEQNRINGIIENYAKDGWIVKIRARISSEQRYFEVEVSRKVESA